MILSSGAVAIAGGAVADPRELVEALHAQYAQIESVHLKAHYTLTLESTDRPAIASGGSFEYWAADRRFRVTSSASEALRAAGIGADRTIVFDGRQGALYLPGTKTLAVRSGEFADSSLIPNPLWLPLGFTGLRSHFCHGCRLALADVRDAGNWVGLGKALRLAGPGGGEPGPGLGVRLAASPPGAPAASVLLARQDGAWLVREVAMDRSAPGGPAPGQASPEGPASQTTLREKSVFDRPAAVAKSLPQLLIPMHMVMSAQGKGLPGGAQEARLEITIDEIQVNEPIAGSVFTVPQEIASTVIDEDLQRVVKAAHCAKNGAQ